MQVGRPTLGEWREEGCREKCVTSLGEKLSVEGNGAAGAPLRLAALGWRSLLPAVYAACFVRCTLIVGPFQSNERALRNGGKIRMCPAGDTFMSSGYAVFVRFSLSVGALVFSKQSRRPCRSRRVILFSQSVFDGEVLSA